MSVWLCIPSARPVAEVEPVLKLWRERGYKIALWRDDAAGAPICDLLLTAAYPGYALAVNALVEYVREDPSAEWCVTGGDDTEPDPKFQAWEIADQCEQHFSGTFGVMQPTGDRFAEGSIDRIAGSPWIGLDFCERAYGGRGPYWPEYRHMFLDEEIMCVAQKLGVFWQRPDLVHRHLHFMREFHDLNSRAVRKPIPAHLVEANSPEHWEHYGAIFRQRKAMGFPGHEPLEVACPR